MEGQAFICRFMGVLVCGGVCEVSVAVPVLDGPANLMWSFQARELESRLAVAELNKKKHTPNLD